MRNLVVILATATIAAVMTAVVADAVAVKNAAGGNSGKIKIAAAKMTAALDALLLADVITTVDAVAIAATRNLPTRNFHFKN